MIAKVEWHPGELYRCVGFIVTNMARRGEDVVAFYNKRGTREQWIREGKARSNGHGCHSGDDAGADLSIPAMVWPCQGSSKAAISASESSHWGDAGQFGNRLGTGIAAAIVTANICAILLLIVLRLFNTGG